MQVNPDPDTTSAEPALNAYAWLVVGVLGMLPGWWKHRTAAAQLAPADPTPVVSVPPTASQELTALRQHGL